MTRITRRSALASATAVVAATMIPVVAGAATGHTEVERLYADLLRARGVHSEVADALDIAHQAAKALYPKPPFPITGKFPTPRLAFQALLTAPGHDEADKISCRKSLEKLDAYDAECSRIQEAHGVTALDIRNEETYDRIMEIQDALLDVPAVTIRDVLLKLLSEWREDIWEQEVDYHGLCASVAITVYHDLERLAEEARS